MGQRLVHVHVDFQSVQEYWSVFVGHEVANEALSAQQSWKEALAITQIAWISKLSVSRKNMSRKSTFGGKRRIVLVVIDYLKRSGVVVQRIENLVQTRISLLGVEEFHKLFHGNILAKALRAGEQQLIINYFVNVR